MEKPSDVPTRSLVELIGGKSASCAEVANSMSKLGERAMALRAVWCVRYERQWGHAESCRKLNKQPQREAPGNLVRLVEQIPTRGLRNADCCG